jgi:hypothetical protein
MNIKIKQPLLITRRLPLVRSKQAPDTVTLCDEGIQKVSLEQDLVRVTYDQQVYVYSGVLNRFSEAGIMLKKGLFPGLKTFVLDHLDSVARDNANAPPPSCCSKPPRKG